MRVTIIIIACLVGIAALSPWFVGTKVEGSIRDHVAQFENLPMYEVSIVEYDKGYGSSDVILSVGFEPEFVEDFLAGVDSQAAPKALVDIVTEGIDFYIDVQHGPVLTDSGFSLGWTHLSMDIDRETYPEWAEFFDLIEDDLLFESNTRVGLTGAGWSKSHVADIDIEMSENPGEVVHFVMTGVKDHTTFTGFGDKISQKGAMEQLSLALLSDESFELSLQNMEIDAQMILADPMWLSPGEATVDIESIDFSAEEFGLEIDTVNIDVAVREGDTPETLTIYESFHILEAVANGHKVSNADFTFSYANISKEFLQSYMESMATLSSVAEEDVAAEFQEKLGSAIEDALAYSPRFNLEKVAFEYEEGHLDASASIGLDSSLLQFPLNMENPMLLMPALDMSADIALTESIVQAIMMAQSNAQMSGIPEEDRPPEEQVAQMVDQQIEMFAPMMVQQGFIKQEGDLYSTKLTFSQGSALVNGMPIPIPGF